MITNAKSVSIVLGFSVIAVIALLFVFSRQIGVSNVRYLESVATTGLRDFYAALRRQAAGRDEFASASTSDLKATLLMEDRYKRYFPFIDQRDAISIATPKVDLGTTNLACAVRITRESYLGVDGAGHMRRLSPEEYRRWPHTLLNNE